jgi:hypothetical protein
MRAGRPPKLGNQRCTKKKCVGYGELGRNRPHSRLNSKNITNVRFAEHYTFIHNDRKIREHYSTKKDKSADYKKHPLGKTLKSIDRLCDDNNKRKHAIKLREEKYRLLHGSTWTHEEKWRFYMALDKVWRTVIEPLDKRINWYQKFGEFIRANPAFSSFIKDDELIKTLGLTGVLSNRRVSMDRMIEAEIDQGSGPLLEQFCYLDEKYEIPRLRIREKDTRQRLKQWEGRPLNDYTGIEEEDPTPTLPS